VKIKTIVKFNPDSFDELVNEALSKGYQLEHRGLTTNREGETFHYAQLVLPDPPAEQETFDPALALRQIKEICEAVTDSCDNCPIKDWCFGPLKNGDDPTDWILPEVE